MLARFRVLLPFELVLFEGENLQAFDFNIPPYTATVHPPFTAVRREASLDIAGGEQPGDVRPYLQRDTAAVPLTAITINGKNVFRCNALQIDFGKEQFNRDRDSSMGNAHGDPSPDLLFDVANRALSRLRSIIRSPRIKAVSPNTSLWCMEYLTDDGEPVPHNDSLIGGRMGGTSSVQLSLIDGLAWSALQEHPYNLPPFTWETLLLDAKALLPEVGPAILLAASALETLIESALNRLARRTAMPAAIWEWINSRQSFWQNPSTVDQWGVLLTALSGRNLQTEEPRLWEKFQNLRSARNNFTHNGRVTIGKDTVEVTNEKALELINGAEELLSWLENQIPQDLRRLNLGREIEIALRTPVTLPPTTWDYQSDAKFH